jgi:hypothetical protein
MRTTARRPSLGVRACVESYAVARFPTEEVAMAVVLVHQGPSITQERYEEVVRKLADGKSRMESPSDWPVAGLLVHAAGQGESGFRVVDVWESEEACNQFGEILAPILQEVGIDEQPELYQAHTFVSLDASLRATARHAAAVSRSRSGRRGSPLAYPGTREPATPVRCASGRRGTAPHRRSRARSICHGSAPAARSGSRSR